MLIHYVLLALFYLMHLACFGVEHFSLIPSSRTVVDHVFAFYFLTFSSIVACVALVLPILHHLAWHCALCCYYPHWIPFFVGLDVIIIRFGQVPMVQLHFTYFLIYFCFNALRCIQAQHAANKKEK